MVNFNLRLYISRRIVVSTNIKIDQAIYGILYPNLPTAGNSQQEASDPALKYCNLHSSLRGRICVWPYNKLHINTSTINGGVGLLIRHEHVVWATGLQVSLEVVLQP